MATELAETLPMPKFAIGDVVWRAGTVTSEEVHPCPDCKGSRKWKAVSPVGTEVDIECPRCKGRGALGLRSVSPFVSKLTLGQVRMEWPKSPHSDSPSPFQYMARETGIGSGNLYYETDLFEAEEQARDIADLRAAKARADLDEQEPERVKYREVYSYTIERALKGEEADKRREAEWAYESLLSRICELSTCPLAPKLGGDGEQINDEYLHCAPLTDDQVRAVQNDIVWLDRTASRYLMQHRAEQVSA
jgi:hypothetical protein